MLLLMCCCLLQWSNQPIYVLDKDNDLDVSQLALQNATDMVKVQPEGPYLVGGHSYGGAGEERWLRASQSATAGTCHHAQPTVIVPSCRSCHGDCDGAGELGASRWAGPGECREAAGRLFTAKWCCFCHFPPLTPHLWVLPVCRSWTHHALTRSVRQVQRRRQRQMKTAWS